MTQKQRHDRAAGLLAIDREMARQHADTIASYEGAGPVAEQIAASLRKTGKLLLLGMGGSHAIGRTVERIYRELGIDAIALPLSEQLDIPLSIEKRTVLITSQSGESAEIVRWLTETGGTADAFGMTLEGESTLDRKLPCLVGRGGSELAFAATRSVTICFGLHLAVMAALGMETSDALAALRKPADVDIAAALLSVAAVDTIVTSGRRLQGLAETIALGLTELSRRPCFSLEGGQLRHGPMEMLGPKVGVILLRGNDQTANLVGAMARSARDAGSPVVVFDISGLEAIPDTTTISLAPATGLAAVFRILPVAQNFIIEFADTRVENAGTPVRTTKITRDE